MRDICFCGPVSSAGAVTDRAECFDCDWTAEGLLAEHLATHHHEKTQHIWRLIWRTTD